MMNSVEACHRIEMYGGTSFCFIKILDDKPELFMSI